MNAPLDHSALAPTPAGPPAKSRLKALSAYLPQLLFVVIGLLVLSNIALWIGLQQARKGPAVTVVGVREMTQNYIAKIASAQLSPQETSLRSQLFIAVAQEEMRRLGAAKGHLVLARECVLSGEQNDITAQLEAAVETKLAQASGGLSNTVGPVSPASATVFSPPSTTPLAAVPAMPAALAPDGAGQ